jgi:hypothetical protein
LAFDDDADFAAVVRRFAFAPAFDADMDLAEVRELLAPLPFAFAVLDAAFMIVSVWIG